MHAGIYHQREINFATFTTSSAQTQKDFRRTERQGDRLESNISSTYVSLVGYILYLRNGILHIHKRA